MEYIKKLNQSKISYDERLVLLYKKKEVVYSKNIEEEIMLLKGKICGIEECIRIYDEV